VIDCCNVIFRLLNTDESTVREQLKILYEQSLIKEMEPGKWVRNVLDQKTGCLSFALYSCMHDAFPGEKVYIQGS